jgi:hypothetical protein
MLRSLLFLLLLPSLVWAQANPKEKTKKSKLSNILLLASVSGKLTGLSFGALATKEILLDSNSADPQKKAFQIGMASGWSFAAVMGGAAYIVDDAQVKPWMFYTEVVTYGAIGAGLGGLAIHSALQEDAQSKALGIRAAIFLSASASAGGAAYLLKKQEQILQLSLSPVGVVATLRF